MYFKIEEIPQKVTVNKRAQLKAVLRSFGAKLSPKTARQERWFALGLLSFILCAIVGYDLVTIALNQREITQSKQVLTELRQQQDAFEREMAPFQTLMTQDFVESYWANFVAMERLLSAWQAQGLSLNIRQIDKLADAPIWQIEGWMGQYADLVQLDSIAQRLGWQVDIIWQNISQYNGADLPQGQLIRLRITPGESRAREMTALLTLGRSSDAL